jgi:anti-anti-sigma regulatory factor
MATALMMDADEFCVPVTAGSVGPNGRAFGEALINGFDRGLQRVIVDCLEWRQLDLGLLSALVKSADFYRKRGGELRLVNLSRELTADIRELRLQGRLGIIE